MCPWVPRIVQGGLQEWLDWMAPLGSALGPPPQDVILHCSLQIFVGIFWAIPGLQGSKVFTSKDKSFAGSPLHSGFTQGTLVLSASRAAVTKPLIAVVF